ncbi:serine hydrolase domain-containing protein [Glycomyces rhizosphaerae]|uniref:Serine hydrolase domain-containing protein n=1 Tax=Glycomyces rhizosphaerae TaxID=2054422 RepID=A0ABV7PU56_9ACTN
MNRMRSIAAVSCASLAALALAAAPAQAAPAPLRADLQDQADAIVAAGAPGVSIAVRDELGAWNGVAGVGDIAKGTPPDPGGFIRTGSITKSFTATMVLQLVEEHQIELDGPIDAYLPGLLPYEETITVEDLLRHQSGLPDYQPLVWPDVQTVHDQRFHTYLPEALVELATEEPLEFTPGDEFAYSNTGYIVLGMLIEEVTDHSYARELAQRILRPAGLHRTYLAGVFPFLPNPSMRGYEALTDPEGPLTDLTTYNMSVSWSTGAIVATQADVNRFYEALLSGDLLGAEQLAQMQETVPAFDGFGYGLGLAGAELCGREIWGHVGGAQGYLSYSFTSADLSRQLTITVNRSLTADPAVSEAITAAIQTEFCRN